MQAISTKFYGPTNYRGSRIRAKADAGTVWVDWKYELGVEENHDRAAWAFARKFGWDEKDYPVYRGSTQEGYVYVFAVPYSLTNIGAKAGES